MDLSKTSFNVGSSFCPLRFVLHVWLIVWLDRNYNGRFCEAIILSGLASSNPSLASTYMYNMQKLIHSEGQDEDVQLDCFNHMPA